MMKIQRLTNYYNNGLLSKSEYIRELGIVYERVARVATIIAEIRRDINK